MVQSNLLRSLALGTEQTSGTPSLWVGAVWRNRTIKGLPRQNSSRGVDVRQINLVSEVL